MGRYALAWAGQIVMDVGAKLQISGRKYIFPNKGADKGANGPRNVHSLPENNINVA
jgi:hypothetical protein